MRLPIPKPYRLIALLGVPVLAAGLLAACSPDSKMPASLVGLCQANGMPAEHARLLTLGSDGASILLPCESEDSPRRTKTCTPSDCYVETIYFYQRLDGKLGINENSRYTTDHLSSLSAIYSNPGSSTDIDWSQSAGYVNHNASWPSVLTPGSSLWCEQNTGPIPGVSASCHLKTRTNAVVLDITLMFFPNGDTRANVPVTPASVRSAWTAWAPHVEEWLRLHPK